MKKYYESSLVRDIEMSNKKENLIKLLKEVLISSAIFTGIEAAIFNESLSSSSDPLKTVFDYLKLNLGVTGSIAALKIMFTKLEAYIAKLRLENVVDALESEKVFIGVDSLQKANIRPLETLDKKTIVNELTLEDRRGKNINLLEYTDDTIIGEINEVYLLDNSEEQKRLILK